MVKYSIYYWKIIRKVLIVSKKYLLSEGYFTVKTKKW